MAMFMHPGAPNYTHPYKFWTRCYTEKIKLILLSVCKKGHAIMLWQNYAEDTEGETLYGRSSWACCQGTKIPAVDWLKCSPVQICWTSQHHDGYWFKKGSGWQVAKMVSEGLFMSNNQILLIRSHKVCYISQTLFHYEISSFWRAKSQSSKLCYFPSDLSTMRALWLHHSLLQKTTVECKKQLTFIQNNSPL